jgi:phospholipid transport system substrate-binding protein
MSEARLIFRSGVADRVDAIWSGARRRRWSLRPLLIALAAGLMNLVEMRRKAFVPLHDQAKPAVGSALVLFARGLLLALIVVAGGLAESRPAAADEAPVAFIRTLGAQALSVIHSDTLPVEKAAYFRQMIHQDFDLTGICRFVLGPDWRIASPPERRHFRSLFADQLVRIYGRQLVESGDGDFVVTGSQTDASGVIVTSQIIRPRAAPIAVEWRLGINHGFYKIEDVAIDGVSMALAQRAAIDDLIAREGGQVKMLLATMPQAG